MRDTFLSGFRIETFTVYSELTRFPPNIKIILSCPSHNLLPNPGTHLYPLRGGDEVFGGGGGHTPLPSPWW